jgi:hypothetical protein
METSHWEIWIIESIIFTQYLIPHTVYTNWVCCYILYIKKAETNHFQHYYTYCDQIHTCGISNFYYNYATRKLHFWLWYKQHIKDKEDSSSSEVPYVTLTIWMTVTTWNEAQPFHRGVITVWHNPTKPWHACLILAMFSNLLSSGR